MTLNYKIAREHARQAAYAYAENIGAQLIMFEVIDANHIMVELQFRGGIIARRTISY